MFVSDFYQDDVDYFSDGVPDKIIIDDGFKYM